MTMASRKLGGWGRTCPSMAHLAWFTTMQDRMRRESAEIASDPAEREEAEQLREWARYLAS